MATETFTGHRGLDMDEPLIFEQGAAGMSGVDLPGAGEFEDRLGDAGRESETGLPGLSEPQVVRHYLRLSRNNYAIDAGMYPLGSCTMKHNPRLNEKLARLAGLADLHPLQPLSTVQGALALIDQCADWLKTLTGMDAIAMSPAAGAHGELCGLMTIRAALEAGGDGRAIVLVPESAHGTNPASAHMCGYKVETIPTNGRGRVDFGAFDERLGPDVAAIMITNPNTCGLFEDEIIEIADAAHAAGAYVYCDGANFNAIVGRVRPGDLGIDAMHLNLHKTFSAPHGGGGPGSGPVVLSGALAPFAPVPYVVSADDGYALVESAEASDASPYGRMKGFHGQFGVFVRTLSYMMSMGADGLAQAASDAVLSANYILAGLSDDLTLSYEGPCMHEVLFDDRFLAETEVTTLDFAKAMIDEGVHPMTMYFPLVVHGALLMEPTETESLASLDQYIGMVKSLARRAKQGEVAAFKEAPRLAPRRRLDETTAARNPVLRWLPGDKAAAE
ncbi:MAG: aminomethyl-transferring glycine dehydrogenase subunit GcvPB [Rhodospirillaceae bacterium]|mgnify:FL=1|nr:aminomethyl-transferring glycine dehydrogenase subunit GcvPB [Rhodospirillaceae bacterium]MBT5177773.1 aminomethyl-transferring glycine dehydrogenase subunit GcvPB [Rhodospirillaceae bacterium]MBT6290091.1 aminomethyl-transferring glycine dehydrogenase subunit GcvPB [Rhodospirillaceae bacterium]